MTFPAGILKLLLASAALLPAAAIAQTETETKLQAIDRTFSDGLIAVRDAYRQSLAKILDGADKVEVYLLDFEMQPAHEYAELGWRDMPSDSFPIMPYGSKSKILKRKTLSPEEMKKLIPILQENLGAKENTGGAFCHFPIHGVRLWANETIIFQSSFCWHCANFYVPFPDYTGSWVGISTHSLEQTMTELMPIPASEIARFEKKNQPKAKAKKK